MITYKFKIASKTTKLNILKTKVNYIWNYCNETSFKSIKDKSKWLSGIDLNYLTIGTSKLLNIASETVNATCKQYAQSRKQFNKRKLKWRTKKSLGWIPFKARSIKVTGNTITYMKHTFKFFKSREIEGKIKIGNFVEDSCGDWYVTLTCELPDIKIKPNDKIVGIDLGISTLVITSEGEKFNNPKLTKKYSDKLGMSQRANKKKLTKSIHRKIKNCRKDNLHKISTKLANKYSTIVVGDLKLNKDKHSLDASFRGLIPLLKYKVSRLNGNLVVVNEAYSTIICSNCLDKTGPSGIEGLSIREWSCATCGQMHDRDVNGAKNILRIGLNTPKKKDELLVSLSEGISVL